MNEQSMKKMPKSLSLKALMEQNENGSHKLKRSDLGMSFEVGGSSFSRLLAKHRGQSFDRLGVRPDQQIQRLKDQVEFRNRFFRMVIHDLRGPATSIQMGSNLALQSVKKMLRTNLKQTSKAVGIVP